MTARAVALAASAACVCATCCPAALAGTSAGIQPSLAPNRVAARTAFTLSLRFAGSAERVPAPLSAMVLRLPAGLSIKLAGVEVCPISRLRSRGAPGCPAASLLGRGRALLEVHAGSQTLPEDASVAVFRGPDRAGHPTFEIFGHGETPLDESSVSTAVLLGDSAPFGSKLVVSVPPIPTLVYEPDASFSSLSMTIGAPAATRGAVSVPRSCPAGGFPFAAAFTFADRSGATATARIPCP